MNKSKVIRFAVIGVVLTTLVATLSQCTGIDEKSIYDLVDEIQRKYFPQTDLNEYIIKDDKLLKQRIERDVDKAIRQVTPEYDRIIQEADKKYQPKYVEEKNNESLCYSDQCKALALPMRLCAPWVDSCPKD
jgi:siderophore synthetase component